MKHARRFGSGLLALVLILQVLAAMCFAQGVTIQVSKAEADAASQKVTVAGAVSGGVGQDISIRIFRGEDLRYIDQFACNADGSFRQSFLVNDMQEGQTLRVVMGCSGQDEPWEKEITVTKSDSGGTAPGPSGGGATGMEEEPAKPAAIAYIKGDAQGLFHPDDAITRAEVAMIFARLGTGTVDFTGDYPCDFSDVKPESWYSDCVGYVQSIGLVNGYADGTFRPDRQISRAEFAKMVAAYAKLSGAAEAVFQDVPSTHWAAAEIAALAENGWVGGYADGTFRPDSPVTRAQVAKIVNGMLQLKPDQEKLDASIASLTTFRDVPAAHWAYYHVLQAANG